MAIGDKITAILALAGGAAGGPAGATVLTGLIQALVQYRKAREAAKLLAPATEGEPIPEPQFLDDSELIELLQTDSAALEAHAARLLDKYAPADPATPAKPEG